MILIGNLILLNACTTLSSRGMENCSACKVDSQQFFLESLPYSLHFLSPLYLGEKLNIWKMSTESRYWSADNYLEWGPNDPNNVRSQTAISPCMSTGFWFANPSPPIMEFFEGFIDLMLHWRNSQTDQRLWNEATLPTPFSLTHPFFPFWMNQ